MSADQFAPGITATHGAGDRVSICVPFLAAFSVAAVAVSTLGDPFGSEIVCATDAAAAQLDEIQFDLGEGPCWEALYAGSPILEPDLQAAASDRWPTALLALQQTGLGAVFTFPMRIGNLAVGAVSLYRWDAAGLPEGAVRDATAMADGAARVVLRRALARSARSGSEYEEASRQHSRREVYQASGMVAAQAGLSVDDAALLLRAHAYAAGRSVRDLSADVVARTIDFTHHNNADT